MKLLKFLFFFILFLIIFRNVNADINEGLQYDNIDLINEFWPIPEDRRTNSIPRYSLKRSINDPVNISGRTLIDSSAFDDSVVNFMKDRSISQASLAVMYNNKLMLAKGYSQGELTDGVLPTTLFRIASLSKPITSAAIMILVQEGKLSLSDKLTTILPIINSPDQRIHNITIRHLLEHLGGWDRELSFDPMFYDHSISNSLNLSLPINKLDIVDFMNEEPLQHVPGTTYAYSNYGYLLLGLIIEKLTNQSYQNFVKEKLLIPLGILDMKLGASLYKNKITNEATYVSQLQSTSVFSLSNEIVAQPYGGFNIENMSTHGGWLSSSVSMMKFAGLFTSDNPLVLSNNSIEEIFSLPENIQSSEYLEGDFYYSLGWAVRDYGLQGRNTWHTGSLPGTYTLIVNRYDGVSWIFMANQRDDNSGLSYDEIDQLLHNAADTITKWSDQDLFNYYTSQTNIPSSSSEIDIFPSEKDVTHTTYFFLEISSPLSIDASVEYITQDGTAKAGQDYIASTGVATIKSGQTNVAIAIDIIGDTIPEKNETFKLLIYNPKGASFPEGINEISAIRSIKDDD